MTKTKIGLGLAALGRPEYINIRTDNSIDRSEEAFKKNTFSVLNEAYKLGVRYFDTAPSYGNGEAFLQEWNDANSYSDVLLGTKWGYTYVANWELGFDGKHEVKDHAIEKLEEQWDVSKQMLPKLKYYQVHSATFESGILKNEAVLNQLYQIKKDTGLHIGITTSGANQKEVIKTALDVKVNGDVLFDSFQVTYNVFDQSAYSILRDVLKQGNSIVIKEALANGRVFRNEKFQQYNKVYNILEALSKKYEVGVDAIALRFIMDNLQPTYVLSGASNKTHLKQNLKTLNFNFTLEELRLLKTLKQAPEAYWKERSLLNWH
ncbi:aldo/keto reductase [Algibacter sp.]|nr:aldo/keto reductase [Algibacter sp.]MDB4274088.1 aldo/keto reductase [Algibacter sp.]